MHKQTGAIKTDVTKMGSESHGYGRFAWLGVALFLVMAAVLMGRGAAVAQSDVPAATRAVTPDEVNEVARQLWCPLCSGVRLDACELKACDQMKDMIALKLSEGEDTEAIKAYFVEQYGPQVMGEPPRQGFNWLAWILPFVALVVGGYLFWRTTQRMVQPATPLGGGIGLRMPPDSTGGALPRARTRPPAADPSDVLDEDDEYTQRLEEELAKYG